MTGSKNKLKHTESPCSYGWRRRNSSYDGRFMKKVFIISTLIILVSCERVSDEAKAYCSFDPNVINAKTDRAAKIAFEGCVIHYNKMMNNR